MRADSQPAENEFARRESPPVAAPAFRASGTGMPVVFLHGIGLNKNAWRKQEDFFAPRRTTIVCDPPGHGENPPLPVRANLSDFSAAAAAALDALEFAKADVVGHSFGGLVAAALLHSFLCPALRTPPNLSNIHILFPPLWREIVSHAPSGGTRGGGVLSAGGKNAILPRLWRVMRTAEIGRRRLWRPS